MKSYLILLMVAVLPMFGIAQNLLKTMDGATYDPKQQRNEIPKEQNNGTIYYKSKSIPVQQSIGQTYDSEQLSRMARKDINGVAGTVAGVDTRSGEVPNIRNAGAAGTAYFVDGVRTYGALPILSK